MKKEKDPILTREDMIWLFNLMCFLLMAIVMLVTFCKTFGNMAYDYRETLSQYRQTGGNTLDYYLGYWFFTFEQPDVMTSDILIRYLAKIGYILLWLMLFIKGATKKKEVITLSKPGKICLSIITVTSIYGVYYMIHYIFF